MKRYPEPTKYHPINHSKYVGNINEIVMRSSWEKKLAHWLDTSPSVLKWGSEIKAIPYFSSVDGRVRRYFPDFWALIKDSNGDEKRYIVEIKPHCQIVPPKPNKNRRKYLEECVVWKRNQDKWAAAKEFASKFGFEFLVFDEIKLGIKR